jgi:hypothetical protein
MVNENCDVDLLVLDQNDGATLKELLFRGCKRVDLGAAVLPKPLFSPDVDEEDFDLKDGGGTVGSTDYAQSREGVAPEQHSAVSTTKYARILHQEFNAVVVEHHLKWAPMCVSTP